MVKLLSPFQGSVWLWNEYPGLRAWLRHRTYPGLNTDGLPGLTTMYNTSVAIEAEGSSPSRRADRTTQGPPGGSETSVSEFPGRVVGTPRELPTALPERSYLAFDPPAGRVKFTRQ